MQHRSTHIRKFSELFVGNLADLLRIFDDARVSHQKARNIRPVFVNVRGHRARYQRARNVGAPTRKSLDRAVRQTAVKARQHRALMLRELRADSLIGFRHHQLALRVELDQILCIDKVIAQKCRHQHRVQIFTARGDIVRARILLEIFANLIEIAKKVNLDAKIDLHRHEAVRHDLKQLVVRQIMLNMRFAQIKNIRNFVV